MAYRMSTMTVLRGTDPEKFAKKLKASITKHKGITTHVAQDLDVGETTVKRWLREDASLRAFIDKVRGGKLPTKPRKKKAAKKKATKKKAPKRARAKKAA